MEVPLNRMSNEFYLVGYLDFKVIFYLDAKMFLFERNKDSPVIFYTRSETFRNLHAFFYFGFR